MSHHQVEGASDGGLWMNNGIIRLDELWIMRRQRNGNSESINR